MGNEVDGNGNNCFDLPLFSNALDDMEVVIFHNIQFVENPSTNIVANFDYFDLDAETTSNDGYYPPNTAAGIILWNGPANNGRHMT